MRACETMAQGLSSRRVALAFLSPRVDVGVNDSISQEPTDAEDKSTVSPPTRLKKVGTSRAMEVTVTSVQPSAPSDAAQ